MKKTTKTLPGLLSNPKTYCARLLEARTYIDREFMNNNFWDYTIDIMQDCVISIISEANQNVPSYARFVEEIKATHSKKELRALIDRAIINGGDWRN